MGTGTHTTRRRIHLALLAALCVSFAFAAGADDEPPLLTDIQILTPQVSSEIMPATVSLQVSASDLDSGLCLDLCDDFAGPSQVSLVHSGTRQQRDALFQLSSGDLNAGVFDVEFVLPVGSANGIWRIESLWLADQSGNRSFFSALDLVLQFPVLGVVNSVSNGDSAAPAVTGLSSSSSAFDSSSDTSVTMTLTAEDPASGLCLDECPGGGTQVRYVNDATGQTRDGVFALSSGTLFSGDFVASLDFRASSATGSWRFDSLRVIDAIGNQMTLSQADLEAMTITPPELTNQALVGDEMAPAISTFSVTPDPIDTTGGPLTASVTVDATDDDSGLCTGPCLDLGTPSQLRFRRADSQQLRYGVLDLSSGSFQNGSFVAQIELPTSGEAGVWAVDQLLLADLAGNRVFVPEPGALSGWIGLAAIAGITAWRRRSAR